MKNKLQLIALIIPLIISANVAQAASCQNCTVTIISGLSSTAAVVTLEFSPSGSSTTQKFYPGETVTIPVPADKCPLRLTAKIYSGYHTYSVQNRCPGDGGEGDSLTCSKEDCKSSTWKIQGGGGAFHLIKQ